MNLEINNKKGGMIGWAFFTISFIFIWAVWLGSFLQDLGQQYIDNNGSIGFEAFFYANLNLWLGLALALGILFYLYTGGNR